MKPDFKFRSRETGEEFYVEAKFRAGTYKGKFEWCKPYQLERYKAVSDAPVMIALGIGGAPNDPAGVALIPLDDIKYTGLFASFVEKYLVKSVSV